MRCNFCLGYLVDYRHEVYDGFWDIGWHNNSNLGIVNILLTQLCVASARLISSFIVDRLAPTSGHL